MEEPPERAVQYFEAQFKEQAKKKARELVEAVEATWLKSHLPKQLATDDSMMTPDSQGPGGYDAARGVNSRNGPITCPSSYPNLESLPVPSMRVSAGDEGSNAHARMLKRPAVDPLPADPRPPPALRQTEGLADLSLNSAPINQGMIDSMGDLGNFLNFPGVSGVVEDSSDFPWCGHETAIQGLSTSGPAENRARSENWNGEGEAEEGEEEEEEEGEEAEEENEEVGRGRKRQRVDFMRRNWTEKQTGP